MRCENCCYSELHFLKKSTCQLSKCKYYEFKKHRPVILCPGRMFYLIFKILITIVFYIICFPLIIIFGSIVFLIIASITADDYTDLKRTIKSECCEALSFFTGILKDIKSTVKSSLQ